MSVKKTTKKEKSIKETSKKEVLQNEQLKNDSNIEDTKRQISNITKKINLADDIREKLLYYLDILNNYIDDFTYTKEKLSGEYLDVKTKDVFEGEMAESLAKHVSDVYTSMISSINHASSISSTLKAEISLLGNYISDLTTEQKVLKNKLL